MSLHYERSTLYRRAHSSLRSALPHCRARTHAGASMLAASDRLRSAYPMPEPLVRIILKKRLCTEHVFAMAARVDPHRAHDDFLKRRGQGSQPSRLTPCLRSQAAGLVPAKPAMRWRATPACLLGRSDPGGPAAAEIKALSKTPFVRAPFGSAGGCRILDHTRLLAMVAPARAVRACRPRVSPPHTLAYLNSHAGGPSAATYRSPLLLSTASSCGMRGAPMSKV